jgi:hypothetical protein
VTARCRSRNAVSLYRIPIEKDRRDRRIDSGLVGYPPHLSLSRSAAFSLPPSVAGPLHLLPFIAVGDRSIASRCSAASATAAETAVRVIHELPSRWYSS